MTVTLKITGMSCEHCQARVQQALSEQSGVSIATVSLINNTAEVVFDETVTSPYALIAAVGEVGYDAEMQA